MKLTKSLYVFSDSISIASISRKKIKLHMPSYSREVVQGRRGAWKMG